MSLPARKLEEEPKSSIDPTTGGEAWASGAGNRDEAILWVRKRLAWQAWLDSIREPAARRPGLRALRAKR